jgi:hypothetical protein
VIVLLEDNAERCRAMIAAIKSVWRDCPIQCFGSAPSFITKLDEFLPSVALISLDHDLGPTRDGFDPGVGRDVSKTLAQRKPACPVIIHSTNVAGASAMKFDLEDAGWRVTAIAPYGDLEWIERSWLPAVRKLLLLA